MSIEVDPDEPLAPRIDLFAAIAWIVFGGAIAVGAWRMDRLEKLHINPYEIPGLVPGLLGTAILLLGVALALRAISRDALAGRSSDAVESPLATQSADLGQVAQGAQTVASPMERRNRYMALVFGMTLFYALGLVGTGLPFWFGTFAFVSAFIFIFDRTRQIALNRSYAKQAVLALIYGAATSAVVSLAFEKIFLVRLP